MSLTISTVERDNLLRQGCELQAAGQLSDALTCFEAAVRISPRDLQTLIQQGFLLIHLKEWKRAAATYERIVPLLPRDHRVWSNLSYLYERCGEFAVAEDRARKALRLAPESGEVWNNLGMALRGQHRLALAAQAFQQALSRQPELALAEFNLATTSLMMGDGDEGWRGYESRCRLSGARLRQPLAPRWDGQPVPEGTLLVYSDQGLGDALQFVRFLPEARRRSQAEIVLSCPGELLSVFEGIDGADRVCRMDEEPACTAEIPVSSLPGLFQTNPHDVPGPSPYLKPRISELRQPLVELIRDISPGKRRVGLVWQGNPAQDHDDLRSVALARLLPLADVPGVTWLSLQVGAPGRSQLADVQEHWRLVDLGERIVDFSDTAAVLQHVDLVITVDTALAHFAGALGRPAWTLLSHTPDWRWGLTGVSCPWYPTLRLFRQPRWGDWDFVVQQVKAALAE